MHKANRSSAGRVNFIGAEKTGSNQLTAACTSALHHHDFGIFLFIL